MTDYRKVILLIFFQISFRHTLLGYTASLERQLMQVFFTFLYFVFPQVLRAICCSRSCSRIESLMNFNKVGKTGFKFFREITPVHRVVKNINVTHKCTNIVREPLNVYAKMTISGQRHKMDAGQWPNKQVTPYLGQNFKYYDNT